MRLKVDLEIKLGHSHHSRTGIISNLETVQKELNIDHII